jgi:hypothetical protein
MEEAKNELSLTKSMLGHKETIAGLKEKELQLCKETIEQLKGQMKALE